MSNNIGYVGEVPNINQKLLNSKSRAFLARWAIPALARPVQIEAGIQAALWAGENATKLGELPVLALVTETGVKGLGNNIWYCGLAEANFNELENLLDNATQRVNGPDQAIEFLKVLIGQD